MIIVRLIDRYNNFKVPNCVKCVMLGNINFLFVKKIVHGLKRNCIILIVIRN